MSPKPSMKMAPEAAATAPRAQYQAPEKLTNPHMPETSPKANKIAVMGRPSLRSAIDAMCKSCIYDPGSGNGGWREQVAGCCSANCPLHLVRPLPVKATNPAAGLGGSGAPAIGAISNEQSHIAVKIGHNNGNDERRAA